MVPLHGLPTPIVDVRLQFSRNHRRNTLLQPDTSIQCIVSLLIQKKLSATPKSRIRLPVSVKVRRGIEATVPMMKVKHAAFTDIEEESRIDAASVYRIRSLPYDERLEEKENLTYFCIC